MPITSNTVSITSLYSFVYCSARRMYSSRTCCNFYTLQFLSPPPTLSRSNAFVLSCSRRAVSRFFFKRTDSGTLELIRFCFQNEWPVVLDWKASRSLGQLRKRIHIEYRSWKWDLVCKRTNSDRILWAAFFVRSPSTVRKESIFRKSFHGRTNSMRMTVWICEWLEVEVDSFAVLCGDQFETILISKSVQLKWE